MRIYVHVTFTDEQSLNLGVDLETGYGVSSRRGTKSYVYLYEGEEDDIIKYRDQLAVVDTPSGGYKLVKITKLEALDVSSYTGTVKRIVALVDTQPYNEAKDRDARREVLEKELRRRAEERQKQKSLEELVGDDPEARKLLDEFNKLSR
jgi:hypothetical protein